jgi:hypothetical protein
MEYPSKSEMKIFLQEKGVEPTKQKEEKRKKPISPRKRKACHSSISTVKV